MSYTSSISPLDLFIIVGTGEPGRFVDVDCACCVQKVVVWSRDEHNSQTLGSNWGGVGGTSTGTFSSPPGQRGFADVEGGCCGQKVVVWSHDEHNSQTLGSNRGVVGGTSEDTFSPSEEHGHNSLLSTTWEHLVQL